VSAVLVTAFLLTAHQGFAFPDRVNQVPNNQWSCGLCHVSAGGGGARTSFGETVNTDGVEGGNVIWANICEIDSDGDSFSNGEELGDPTCTWVFGDPNPAGEITNPADAESVPSEEMMMVEAGEMMAEAGEMMTEDGEMMVEAGEMMAEAGEMMTEDGEMMAEAGEMMAEAGEMMTEAGEMMTVLDATGGCDAQNSASPFSLMLSFMMFLGLGRLSRRYS
jgi:hypothetical protein